MVTAPSSPSVEPIHSAVLHFHPSKQALVAASFVPMPPQHWPAEDEEMADGCESEASDCKGEGEAEGPFISCFGNPQDLDVEE